MNQKIEINYDFRPYVPDIFLKDNIFNSSDTVNSNNNISVNSTIFVINLKNENLQSIYNDPNYMLYGIADNSYTYLYPPLYYYYNFKSSLTNSYKSLDPQYEISNETKYLLNSIGYNIKNIDLSVFEYREMDVYDTVSYDKRRIIYMFFNLINYDSNYLTNYNNYNSTIYYNSTYFNVLIYPFNYSTQKIEQLRISYNFNTEPKKIKNSNNNIESLFFDDRELIKFIYKIDYKYLENLDYTTNSKSNIETLLNYSLNIINYHNYIEEQKNKICINNNLNEISKLYYYTPDYLVKYSDSYEQTLNNKYINNNKTFSNDDNKYSFSFGNKVANLKLSNFKFNNYCNYDYNLTNNSTTYQQMTNYYLNSYFNIFNKSNDIILINCYLYKFFVLINPKIIDLNYMISNVTTNIEPLITNSNILRFGNDVFKLQLDILNNIKSTELYYINKYKIIFQFFDDIDGTIITSNYIIILSIAFYNGIKLNITSTDKTLTNDDLGYVNYGTLQTNISLNPTIDNFNQIVKINEDLYGYNLMDIKKYFYLVDYSNLSQYKNQYNFIKFCNYSFFIPNINTPLKTSESKYYNNVWDVLMLKMNNFIKNFINTDSKYIDIVSIEPNIKNYICTNILYDSNIIASTKPKYIEYFSYFPKLSDFSTSLDNYFNCKYYKILSEPNSIINQNQFQILPAGKYVKFNYINYKSLNNILDEQQIIAIKNISNVISYNFCLMILLPYDINLDDSFYCDYSNTNFWEESYSMNISNSHTSFYIVLTDSNANPQPYNFNSYSNNYGLIYGIKLYNYYNFLSPNLNIPIKPNLYFNNYINFCQMMIIMEIYKNYTDSNNMGWDKNNTMLKLHNSEKLKEIVYYDFKRFSNTYSQTDITNYFNKFLYSYANKLYSYKYNLNQLETGIKITIYLLNLNKIIDCLKKCSNYYKIVKFNMSNKNINNTIIIDAIKSNLNTISELIRINYDLDITFGSNDTLINSSINEISETNNDTLLENINLYGIKTDYCLNYFLIKFSVVFKTLENINKTYNSESETESETESNIFTPYYNKIFQTIINNQINYQIGDLVLEGIDNIFNTTSIETLNLIGMSDTTKYLLLEQIISFIKIIYLNTNKINELYNLVKLMSDDYDLNNNVVKNYYIYNIESYENFTNVPKFKINVFLSDVEQLINKISNDLTNEYQTQYLRAIEQNILIYLYGMKKYFNIILDKIVGIYKSINQIYPDNDWVNIYDVEQIGIFYFELEQFSIYSNNFFNTMNLNQINMFEEYKVLQIQFTNLQNSSKEFLLYIQLKNIFMSEQLELSESIYISDDLLKIIKLDVFLDFIFNTIKNFDDLILKQKTSIVLTYMERAKENYSTENLPLKKFFGMVINDFISELKLCVITNTDTKILVNGTYDIIPYKDLLLFKGTFESSSFNFNKGIFEMIELVNQAKKMVLENYYTNPENNIFYKTYINYTYLNSPYNYINVNNINIKSF